MRSLPREIVHYLIANFLETRKVAFLMMDQQQNIREWGGDLELYGVNDVTAGTPLSQCLDYLSDFFPDPGTTTHLPFLRTSSGIFADIHFFSDGEKTYLLLLDASAEQTRLKIFQQAANDLSLLRQKEAKLLEQQLQQPAVDAEKIFALAEQGERKEASVLVADLRGFTRFAESHPPQSVFQTLHIYMGAMTQPVHSNAGFVHKVIGDSIMAIFGLLPATQPAAVSAVRAANSMVQAVREVAQSGRVAPQSIGIGIASGQISVALVKGRNHVDVTAIGEPVKIAAGLEKEAREEEILVDQTTFNSVNGNGKFRQTAVHIQGINEPYKAFSSRVA